MIVKKEQQIIRIFSVMVVFFLVIQITSCGVLLYPERQKAISTKQLDPDGRQIDPAVVIMDALWCIPFLIPGVVAFAIDFSTGAVYLPKSETNNSALPLRGNEMAILKIPLKKMDQRTLGRIISREIGMPVDLEDQSIQRFKIDKRGALMVYVAGVDKGDTMTK